MHGFAIRVPHLAPRTRRPIRRHQDSRVREIVYEDRVEDDQGNHDIETDLALSSLGDLVLLLQVSQFVTIIVHWSCY